MPYHTYGQYATYHPLLIDTPPMWQAPSLCGKRPLLTQHPTPLAHSTPAHTYPTTPGVPRMPHMPHIPHVPATHITITPKRVYINGEPAHVERDSLELSTPSSPDVQTVTLTITPTTVTILNDDNPDTINATLEAVTRTTQDEAVNGYSTYIRPNDLDGMLDTRTWHEAIHM